jgi:hypothetical protein
MEVLRVFRPLDYQEKIYTLCPPELIVLGGNRSSKTLNCAIKFASEMLRIPVTTEDGRQLPLHSPEGPMLGWIIGKHENHIGTTIYDTLFKPGLFKIIRDEETNEWRTYRPWVEADRARSREAVASEPLIPRRFIKEEAWSDKKGHVYDEVTLINGNVIRFYSSKAEAKQGDKLNWIWIDEDIDNEDHVPEWQARTIDLEGCLMWSAYPHSSNAALADLVDKADKFKHHDKPYTIVINLTMSQNPFLNKEKVAAVTEGYDDDTRRARDLGQFTFDSQLVYPEFNRAVHLSPPLEEGDHWDDLDEILAGGTKPSDWCRSMVLDPGFNHTAVLFCAVVPEHLGGYWVVEDEVYLKRKNLDDLCQTLRPMMQGFVFEDFVIDGRAARQTPLTGGPTYRQQFVDAFQKYDISCRSTGNDFVLGSDNIEARINLVRQALAVNLQTGRPKLRLHRHRTKAGCQHEFARYKYRMAQGKITDQVVARYDHAMDCLGYWVSRNPVYVYPDSNDKTAPRIFRQFKKLNLKNRQRQGQGSTWLGPVA